MEGEGDKDRVKVGVRGGRGDGRQEGWEGEGMEGRGMEREGMEGKGDEGRRELRLKVRIWRVNRMEVI